MRAIYPIPTRLNLWLTAIQVSGSLALLAAASHTDSLPIFIFCVIAFSFLMQMGFSLLHEAEHDKLHPDARTNHALGILLAALFPGSYSFMKTAHLSHHRRNRSDAELVDYIRPQEAKWSKYFQYYFLICGGVWIGTPLLSIAIALTPSALLKRLGGNQPKKGVALYLQFVKEAGQERVRAEMALTALLFSGAIYGLGLSFSALAWCYLAFAFSWSSQQYIYHIRTPRHLIEGALNLKLWKPLELLYLGFNYHLTHHRRVNVPWVHVADMSEEPTQDYWKTYARIWNPPEPVEKAWPVEFQRSGPLRAPGTVSVKNADPAELRISTIETDLRVHRQRGHLVLVKSDFQDGTFPH